MSYYFLEITTNKNELFVEEYQSDHDDLSFALQVGENLSLDFVLELYYSSENKIKTDLLGIVSLFVVSSTMKSILEKLDKDYLQFKEIKLVNVRNHNSKKYFLVNILKNLDAIDFEKSQLTFYDNSTVIDTVTKLVLDRQAIKDRNIFRLSSIRRHIVISEMLKNELENAQVTGAKFVPVENFKKD